LQIIAFVIYKQKQKLNICVNLPAEKFKTTSVKARSDFTDLNLY